MRALLRTTFASLVAWAARLVRRSKRIVVAVSVALCAVILLLGWLSYRSVKEVVTEDFNRQRLVLAKYAARQISHSLAMLRKELRLLGQSPALQYQERLAVAGRLESAFMSVKDDGAVQIRYVAAPGAAVHLYDSPGYRRTAPGTDDTLHCSGPPIPPTIPLSGKIFTSLKDKDKPAAVSIVKKLLELGLSVIATRGTAQYLNEHGIEVQVINKVIEGRPHIVDLIKNKEVHFIMNTVSGAQAQRDSFSIRQSALQYKVPFTTTISGAIAAVQAIETLKKKKVNIKSIQEYHRDLLPRSP